MFVGDNPLCDIKGAIDAGLSSAWLINGQGWDIKEYTPKYIINNICELMNIPTKPFLHKKTLEFYEVFNEFE